jgi:hypothetical protein
VEAIAELEGLLRKGPAHAQVESVERHDEVSETVPPASFDIR